MKAYWLGVAVLGSALVGCGGDSDNDDAGGAVAASAPSLSYLSRYESGLFDESAAEIPAYDATSKRLFVVNAEAGAVDVLDISNPASPLPYGQISVQDFVPGGQVNSVAVANGVIALAVEAPVKTDPGYLALYYAGSMQKITHVQVGAQPDMVTFTPDGKTVLLANEGEPSDDYSIDPEGSISVVDVTVLSAPVVATADFAAFNASEAALKAAGVRIYGPGASVAQDLEPEYIVVSGDGSTAWATLQENNALAKLDIASATITDILPLGEKDLGVEGNGADISDEDGVINIDTWAGVSSLYLPDAMAAFEVDGATYLVTANEGDARAWGEDNAAYWGTEGVGCAGDSSQGFVEEFRVKHLVHASGFDRRCGDDLPPQLRELAAGALLSPTVFGWCGATAGDPGSCRADDVLGRLNITWTMGYRVDGAGNPVMFDSTGAENVAGDRLMYDRLYGYGGRSISVWDADGNLVWDGGDQIEQFLASDVCFLGVNRDIPCADFFNSAHDEGNAFDSRSDAKGPEPEGVTVGQVDGKPYAFVGLERMGGILVYDLSIPSAPELVDYLNSRNDWTTEDVAPVLSAVGDLGPEGLVFIPADQSPNGEALLVVGNEVSGTTALYSVGLK